MLNDNVRSKDESWPPSLDPTRPPEPEPGMTESGFVDLDFVPGRAKRIYEEIQRKRRREPPEQQPSASTWPLTESGFVDMDSIPGQAKRSHEELQRKRRAPQEDSPKP